MSSTPSTPELLDRLPALTLRDEHRLRRRLQSGREPLERIAAEVAKAEERLARRLAARPVVTYPPELPVSQARDELAEAIERHQVVVVAGETGSGKTTQLPKICLDLGRGVRGTIGHTQPRRIAARTVADRIAEELGTELGTAVGFKVRFADRSGDDTLVKLMTDGILLAEIQHDRELRQYDTLIVDEAHERSLNVDFLLGYLKRLLPRRPDLKVIVTSATIETERFSEHFGGAPVVTVSGRTYPVEVRYRPPEEDADPVQAVVEAVVELQYEGPGDVLVFLSGEREIRDTADALRRLDLRDTEVLPLYARLSHAEQHRVFERPRSGRRVVLATNVAETSLTVPGIRYVVDPGTARISRYSTRLKVQRLPIEPVSQASANQRKGRCGRVAEGICVRLYSEEDFASRPEYTDPEIQRTNLASVVLQMTALGLGQVEEFPFVDPPDPRAVRDGIALLHELGAIESPRGTPRLTQVGRRLASLPLDPRFGRMVLEADSHGCLREVLVIAAGLTVQDPRERPTDKQQQADAMHARFVDPTSDFLSYLTLWNHVQERQDALSSSGFRRLCKAEFLHYLRVREWQDLHGQLTRIVNDLGLHAGDTAADPKRVHTALLAGLLSHVGLKEGERNEYLGARGARFAVFPGSALFKKPPRWVVAAELVETSRLWGRICARIEPEWVEPLASHLVVRRHSEPRWSRKRGAVVATERVTLYGIPIVVGRTVDYGRIDPVVSRSLFIRAALVEGDWETHHAFFKTNAALRAEVEGLEDRARRRDLVVDDEVLYDFYDERVPADVVSARHFDAWWKKERRARPDLLTFPRSLLVRGAVDLGDFPGEWVAGDLRLPLTYRFDPGDPADGVTAHVPLAVLPRVSGDDLAWQVPGLRHDLVTALVKSLPKSLRVSFVPVPDTAAAVLRRMAPRSGPLLDVLGDELLRMTGTVVPYDAWDWSKVPPHLRMNVRVLDDAGRVVAEGRDVEALREAVRPAVKEALSSAASSLERRGLTSWVDVPRTFASGTVRGFPALVDEGATVGVKVLATEAEQAAAHRAGVRRLLLLALPDPLRAVVGRLPKQTKLALGLSPYPTVPALLADCVVAALDSFIGDVPWEAAEYEALRERVRPGLADATYEVVVAAADALAAERRVREQGDLPDDVRAQLDRLVHAGFVAEVGRARLRDLPRYLAAVEVRLERLPRDPSRDRLGTTVVQSVEKEYDALVASLPPARRGTEEVARVRWMIEELRVQLFAPTMRTAFPVSEKRVLRAMDDLGA
ncbi:MAG TPA: ATP-dependent RNA helicase HrpA [Frankiaceae bacterium]|jgi:ATP-dependent helicase HrpA|nr:ATP-dependent RNA helicase HrpA [Frankiaceae bacterium]